MKPIEHFLKDGMRGIWFVPEERDDLIALLKKGIEESKTEDAKFMRLRYLEKLERLLEDYTIDTRNG